MKLIGPERYELKFDARKFQISALSGNRELSDRVRARRPKLYVVTSRGRPVYVGLVHVHRRVKGPWRLRRP